MRYRKVEKFNRKDIKFYEKMKQENLEKMAINGIHPFRPF